MANTDKEFYDEIATIYSIANQSVPIHKDDKTRLQQVAACAAIFAMKLAKNYDLNVIDAAPYIPYWIWQIQKLENDALKDFQMSPLPKGVKIEKRSEGQRQGGIDYTAADIIHRVIDPLFLDNLKEEFAKIKVAPSSVVKVRMLQEFQDKLADLKFFDPACGCGNFLVETYVCLRNIENEILAEREQLKKELAVDEVTS